MFKNTNAPVNCLQPNIPLRIHLNNSKQFYCGLKASFGIFYFLEKELKNILICVSVTKRPIDLDELLIFIITA